MSDLSKAAEVSNLVRAITSACAEMQPRPTPQVVIGALALLTASAIKVTGGDKERNLALFNEGVRAVAMTTRTGTPLQAIKFALAIEGEYPVSTQGFLQSWWDGELDAVNLTDEFAAFCAANPEAEK